MTDTTHKLEFTGFANEDSKQVLEINAADLDLINLSQKTISGQFGALFAKYNFDFDLKEIETNKPSTITLSSKDDQKIWQAEYPRFKSQRDIMGELGVYEQDVQTLRYRPARGSNGFDNSFDFRNLDEHLQLGVSYYSSHSTKEHDLPHISAEIHQSELFYVTDSGHKLAHFDHVTGMNSYVFYNQKFQDEEWGPYSTRAVSIESVYDLNQLENAKFKVVPDIHHVPSQNRSRIIGTRGVVVLVRPESPEDKRRFSSSEPRVMISTPQDLGHIPDLDIKYDNYKLKLEDVVKNDGTISWDKVRHLAHTFVASAKKVKAAFMPLLNNAKVDGLNQLITQASDSKPQKSPKGQNSAERRAADRNQKFHS